MFASTHSQLTHMNPVQHSISHTQLWGPSISGGRVVAGNGMSLLVLRFSRKLEV